MPAAKVNKVSYSLVNTQVAISGGAAAQGVRAAPFGIAAFSQIDYGTKLERAKWYGASGKPQLRSDPRADFTSSITLPLYWWRYIIRRARELKVPLAYLEFTLSVSYAQKLQPLETDTLIGCALMEIGNSHKDGTDNLIVEMPLDPMDVFYQGENVFGEKLSA